jgi:release factor glutamine methyltransferase
MCTGSGAVALFLKHHWPESRVIGTDSSSEALAVARSNGASVEWREGDLFDALDRSLMGGIDLVVANPPYIARQEWSALPADVRHEPRAALVAGERGTEVIERILGNVSEWLAPGGEAWIEIGETQSEELRKRHRVTIYPDQYGKDRFAMVRRD